MMKLKTNINAEKMYFQSKKAYKLVIDKLQKINL